MVTEASVDLWRLESLRKAGFTIEQAQELADCDWHAAAKLLEAGCPPQLVLAILKE